jgi:hypothetical protein
MLHISSGIPDASVRNTPLFSIILIGVLVASGLPILKVENTTSLRKEVEDFSCYDVDI